MHPSRTHFSRAYLMSKATDSGSYIALKSGDKEDEEEKYEEDDAQEEPQASFSSENEVRNRCRVFFQLYFLQNRASFAYSYFSCTFVAGDEY